MKNQTAQEMEDKKLAARLAKLGLDPELIARATATAQAERLSLGKWLLRSCVSAARAM